MLHTPTPTNASPFPPSPQIRRRQHLHHTSPLTKPRPKNTIRILKHAILQTHHDELAPLEPRLDQAPDILRVGEIERGVDFVEDVHGRGLELEEGHDEGEGDEGAIGRRGRGS